MAKKGFLYCVVRKSKRGFVLNSTIFFVKNFKKDLTKEVFLIDLVLFIGLKLAQGG